MISIHGRTWGRWLGPLYTKDHEFGPWKMMAFVHGPTWWSNIRGSISLEICFAKSLGLSLGVNWMWAKRNDRESKGNVLFFFSIYVQKGNNLEKKEKRKIKFHHSPVFFSLHLLFSKKVHHFFAMSPLLFSTRTFFLPLPPQNPLDHVSG